MAADDCAIVVGVARYFEPATYPPLQGPVHDVASVYKWLTSKSGGDVPKQNIRKLVTAKKLLASPAPVPGSVKIHEWQPSVASIESNVFSLILDKNRRFIPRPNGRLYLYFSGHGFTSERDGYGAALFTAEAGGNHPANLGGTLFAEAIAKMGVFGQIVLIMDCCRDALATSPYGRLTLTDAEAPNAQSVVRMEIYAVPKGGKAQEGELEPGGPTAGYLTNAVLRALREIPPNVVGQVSAQRLADYISVAWDRLIPAGTSPPKPRIQHPFGQATMYFPTGRENLVDQEFSVRAARSPDFKVWLESRHPNMDLPRNMATFSRDFVSWTGSDPRVDVPLSAPDAAGRQTFTLRLLPIAHELNTSVPAPAPLVFTPGGACVDL